MRLAAQKAFPIWSVDFEGDVNYPYADIYNLVTSGIGNLLDLGARNGTDCSPAAMSLFVAQPWKHKADWSLASDQEKIAAFTAIKNAGACHKINYLQIYAALTDLRLTKDDVAALVATRMRINDAELTRIYPAYPEWPADAQFALNSWAWACGADASFPKMHAALSQSPPDFRTAAVECKISNANPKRNAANNAMFKLAAEVLERDLDPEVVYFLSSPSEVPTLPSLPPTE
jgi:hypothetical protein